MKIVVSDHALPGTEELADRVRTARAIGRSVAIHAVTRAALMLTLTVLEQVGSHDGDRIEHAAVAPPDAVTCLHRLGLRVVTQPSLVTSRGDDYVRRVDPDDLPHLWRYGSLLDAGIAVAASSDAPYGDLDPWATIRAARERRTPSGRVVGRAERVDPPRVLDGFLSGPSDPGGIRRQVVVGAPADLVLLDTKLEEVLADPRADRVRATMIGGTFVHGLGSAR